MLERGRSQRYTKQRKKPSAANWRRCRRKCSAQIIAPDRIEQLKDTPEEQQLGRRPGST